jgi:hypothetical protein
MIPTRTKLMAAPALLVGALAAAVLHQPSDQASAYSDSGSTVYAAQMLTPTSTSLRTPRAPHSGGNVPIPHSAPLAPAHPQAYDVRGIPSISVAMIDQVLSAYGSPMAGDGKAIYDLGVKYGIDPAYCLAFFIHESAAGTRGEAVLTHSVGNIRAVAGAPSMDGYRYYSTWQEGAEDWYRLISTLYVRDWKLSTVDQIIPVYAPSGDNNDPSTYVDDVEQLVSAWRVQS